MQCLVTTWADVWDEPFRIGSESGDARRHGRVLRECPSGICISLEGPWTHPAARCGARLIGADVPNVTVPRVGRRPPRRWGWRRPSRSGRRDLRDVRCLCADDPIGRHSNARHDERERGGSATV